MIKSRFSKAIIPLAFTTAISGGMLVKNAISEEKKEIKIEQTEKTTNPIEDPAVLGTIFTLGLIGTAGAAALGRAVDLRYKECHEKIEDIFDIASLKESDYYEIFLEECEELDKQGVVYDKEELRKQKYTPKTKKEVLEYINNNVEYLKRVTRNVNHDKSAARQLYYLIEEIKSAVNYGKDFDEDIKERMLYQFDRATTSKKEWAEKDKQYRTEHPEVDFDKTNGIPYKKKPQVDLEKAILNEVAQLMTPARIEREKLLQTLYEIKNNLTILPELLNKYDREECLDLIQKAVNGFNISGKFDDDIYSKIMRIFVSNQQTY